MCWRSIVSWFQIDSTMYPKSMALLNLTMCMAGCAQPLLLYRKLWVKLVSEVFKLWINTDGFKIECYVIVLQDPSVTQVTNSTTESVDQFNAFPAHPAVGYLICVERDIYEICITIEPSPWSILSQWFSIWILVPFLLLGKYVCYHPSLHHSIPACSVAALHGAQPAGEPC